MSILCKEDGGAHTTHNSGDCKKYKKDGTLKNGFKNMKTHSRIQKLLLVANQLEFSKLRKSIKKDKTCKKRRKGDYDCVSSDDSLGIGIGSTGDIVWVNSKYKMMGIVTENASDLIKLPH